MRIAIAQVSHETNTFSPEPTTEASFRRVNWLVGQEAIDVLGGLKTYFGGMVTEAGRHEDCELLPVFASRAAPAGKIERETWNAILAHVIEGLRALGPLDGICLDIHGAGVTEDSNDLEGDLLAAIRAESGHDVPIVATLDLHGNVSTRMVENADMLLGVIEYPHTDTYERGQEAMKQLIRIIRGEISPRMTLLKLPLIIPASTTYGGTAKQVKALCLSLEDEPHMLDCTFFHGFPPSDQPDTGCSVVAISDGNLDPARRAARKVAEFVWTHRDRFGSTMHTPHEAIDLALETAGQPVVLNEPGDNPGAGCPGDGTHLLETLVERDVPGTIFYVIADREVVAAAHEAGEGAVIDVVLGAKSDPRQGKSLALSVKVERLGTKTEFVSSGPVLDGETIRLGRTCVLMTGNVTIIVTDIKSQPFNDDILRLHDLDASTFKIVAIKSSQHFRAYFESRAARIIPVETSGVGEGPIRDMPYEHVGRKYPVVDDIVFEDELIVS